MGELEAATEVAAEAVSVSSSSRYLAGGLATLALLPGETSSGVELLPAMSDFEEEGEVEEDDEDEEEEDDDEFEDDIVADAVAVGTYIQNMPAIRNIRRPLNISRHLSYTILYNTTLHYTMLSYAILTGLVFLLRE